MSLDRTQAFFHQYANDFDAIYGNQKGPFNGVINSIFRKSMRLRFEKSVAGCNPIAGRTVLDVGCGPGHYSITLAQRGAERVVGIDFAEGMLQLAHEHARKVGVDERCQFMAADFYTYAPPKPFDYVIVMGFMDYMAEPEKVVAKVLSLTGNKAFFSFPVAGGFLGWLRTQQYKNRCDLFLYTEDRLKEIFSRFPEATANIERIERDYFVTLTQKQQAS